MLVAAQIVTAVAAALHVVFFLFESVLWSRPAVYGRFGIASQDAADTIRPMAYNQGFYNLFLALGAAVGIVLLGSPDTVAVGGTLVIFATACMALAGVILATTGRRYRTSAALQFVPAAAALILTVLAIR